MYFADTAKGHDNSRSMDGRMDGALQQEPVLAAREWRLAASATASGQKRMAARGRRC